MHREAPDGVSWSVLAALVWLNDVTQCQRFKEVMSACL